MAVGLEETAIQELVRPRSGPQLWSGMYDIYGFTHWDVNSVPSAFYQNPQVATISIDYAELSPTIVWRAGDGNAEESIKSAAYSTNSGSSWTPVTKEPAGTTNGGTIAVSANGSRVVWSPNGASSTYYTSSSGKTWTLSAGLPAEARVASDRVNPNTFYAFKNGTFYTSAKIDNLRGIVRSDDGGATWVRINDDQHQWAWTGQAITGDPRIYGRVYIGTNGRGISYGDIAP